jgi:uncharacterized protein (DUF362 family)
MEGDAISRREALKKMGQIGIAALGAGLVPAALTSGEAWGAPASKVCVATGGNMAGRLGKLLKGCGGIERFVRKGSKVYLKPNIGWAREPQDAADTNPDLVELLIRLCYKAGAKEVRIYENTCDNYVYCFQKSGIKDAAERAGAKLYAADSKQYYTSIKVPQGKALKNVDIVKYLQEADVFINVPIAKNHSAARYTLGMKNMMGVIFDRGYWHKSGLDQCIADFMTVIKPQLTIVDATRILMTGGPKGPGQVKELNTLVAGTDFVAVDAYASTFFGSKGVDVPYIKLAGDMGLGTADLSKIKVEKV